MRMLRMIRIMRLVPVLRIVRVARFINNLRWLIHQIFTGVQAVAWSLVLMVMLLYIFGILFKAAVDAHKEDIMSDAHLIKLQHWFGTLHASMHTLLGCIMGGMDWSEVAEALGRMSWVWTYLFTIFVVFCIMILMNSITGVLCHCAIDSVQRNHEQVVKDMRRNAKHHERVLHGLFRELSGDGIITLSDFERAFKAVEVRAFFQTLDLEPADAWSLFRLIDKDTNGGIDVAEFLEGCLKLRGHAKSVDIAELLLEVHTLQKQITVTSHRTERIVSSLSRLRKHVKLCLEKGGIGSQIHDTVTDVIADVFFGNC
eukprot:TRINITY_DN18877_c0_g1_i1.p1 TRINITY_DN18877_c0_g1~~TRINITY_DN18877_c0_g1_i1.p1  ORF type:complete len:335 (+),score=39.02 TRINITY_DN18877_c0_g1_i1:68-1006(+)